MRRSVASGSPSRSCTRAVPAINTEEGIRPFRAASRSTPTACGATWPASSVRTWRPRDPRCRLAKAYKPEELARSAYTLYERFRPAIPEGVRGWGTKGELDLKAIQELAKERG